ncbi:RNA 3'-terminal phosphate cyclase/enolpyruvate transferase [Cladochytrium replicatum]|nr:RNA 3'-terminal phosphate cyclase/enolpyruvate transferase [Cladochytrium replicatum]
MAVAKIMRFEGHNHFRQRLILATLSGKPIRIDKIRSEEEEMGLRDYEASFLRLLEKLTNGSVIEISYTGTTVLYRPGVIQGGRIMHAGPISRSVGYFLEAVIALAPFAKTPVSLTFTGVTNDNTDVSVDTLRTVVLPQLKRFGIDSGLELQITKRGAPPYGGGEVTFKCPIVRTLQTVNISDEGRIKRIRGIAYATRISPQMANRVVESARSLLTRYIPDVYIYTDVYKGAESGLSPGYGLTLVAETDNGNLISAECAYQPRKFSANVLRRRGRGGEDGDAELRAALGDPEIADVDVSAGEKKVDEQLKTREEVTDAALEEDYGFPTPEDLGVRGARLLLHEIRKGGCVDTNTQWLPLLFIALGPQDVGKVRLGGLSPFTVQLLRDLRTFLGVTFKVEADVETKTVLLTTVGVGFVNVSKRAQ